MPSGGKMADHSTAGILASPSCSSPGRGDSVCARRFTFMECNKVISICGQHSMFFLFRKFYDKHHFNEFTASL
ncbi:hypothetical protein ANANG_G00122910 [Anguilla anguilla]|uniref:Uncharacterized protein n=1 Tax=Anguilla anguilla TaxID=7936 RepID=A0A9D3MDT9_ANGAN|nr:hypothetical protein ANANG_G00122910 [Anguilla anguilla]